MLRPWPRAPAGSDGWREGPPGSSDRLDEEVDEAADGGAGRPAPDDLQVEEQRGIERQHDDPADVHVLGDPEDPRGDAGPRCDRPQHRLGAVDEVRLDDDLPRLRSPRQQVVHGALPDAGEGGPREHHHGLAAEPGDRDLRPVGERVPLRQDDAEQHRAEDDAVEVTVLLRPAPDDRCIGPRLPDRLDGVVPRAGRHEDLDARDGDAHRSQRAVEDPVGHRADPQGHLLPARGPGGSHVLAGPVDLGQDHPRPLRQDAPRRRQLGSAWSAIEERDAQVPLQRTDLLRERRSGDVQPARGSGEAPLLGHGEEVPELAQVHRTTLPPEPGPGRGRR